MGMFVIVRSEWNSIPKSRPSSSRYFVSRLVCGGGRDAPVGL